MKARIRQNEAIYPGLKTDMRRCFNSIISYFKETGFPLDSIRAVGVTQRVEDTFALFDFVFLHSSMVHFAVTAIHESGSVLITFTTQHKDGSWSSYDNLQDVLADKETCEIKPECSGEEWEKLFYELRDMKRDERRLRLGDGMYSMNDADHIKACEILKEWGETAGYSAATWNYFGSYAKLGKDGNPKFFACTLINHDAGKMTFAYIYTDSREVHLFWFPSNVRIENATQYDSFHEVLNDPKNYIMNPEEMLGS